MANVNGYGLVGVGGVYGTPLLGFSWGTGVQVDASGSSKTSASFAGVTVAVHEIPS